MMSNARVLGGRILLVAGLLLSAAGMAAAGEAANQGTGYPFDLPTARTYLEELPKSRALCESGTAQSPVNVVVPSTVSPLLKPLRNNPNYITWYDYTRNFSATIRNTDHSVVVDDFQSSGWRDWNHWFK